MSELRPLHDRKHGLFWSRWWLECRQGCVKVPETAVAELFEGCLIRKEIAKQQAQVLPLSESISDEAEDLKKWLEDQGKLTGKRAVGIEDLRIIVTARRYGLVLVTEESPNRRSCNMPAVCRMLNVPFISLAELLAKLGI